MVLQGVDVSHWQGDINHLLIKAHGIAFVISKLTEGESYVDPYATKNRQATKAAGMFSGLYHFAKGGSALAEADHFCSAAGDITGEFTALDWEINIPGDPVQWCLAWLQRVESKFGVRPFIYMDQSRLRSANWSAVFSRGYPLWLAKYDNLLDPPNVAPNVAVMKQYTSNGSIDGVLGNVDLDVFYGNAQDLQAYCKSGTVFPAPSPISPPPRNPWDTLPTLAQGMLNDNRVRSLQQFLHDNYPAYRQTCGELAPIAGNYATITACWVREFQRRSGITGPDANGSTVGPQTKAALWAAGWRG